MNDPYMMQGGAPTISGKWFNPHTGDSFEVRDTYIEDNNIVIMTMDGRRISLSMLGEYVQGEAPQGKMPDYQPAQINKKALADSLGLDTDDPLNQELNENIKVSNKDTLYTDNNTPTVAATSVIDAPLPGTISIPTVQLIEESEDEKMIKRVLGKATTPDIDCTIKWNRFPMRQMEMLIDFMDISVDDICDYFMSKLDVDAVREDLKKQIAGYIEKKMIPEDVTEEERPPMIPLSKPAPKAQKKKK